MLQNSPKKPYQEWLNALTKKLPQDFYRKISVDMRKENDKEQNNDKRENKIIKLWKRHILWILIVLA